MFCRLVCIFSTYNRPKNNIFWAVLVHGNWVLMGIKLQHYFGGKYYAIFCHIDFPSFVVLFLYKHPSNKHFYPKHCVFFSIYVLIKTENLWLHFSDSGKTFFSSFFMLFFHAMLWNNEQVYFFFIVLLSKLI